MTNRLILIDGECVLCSRSAQFIADKTDNYRFATLQSAQEFKKGLDSDSVVLIKNGEAYRKSDAVIEVMKDLDFNPYLVKFSNLVPKTLRDLIYGFVAKIRFKLFGKKKCRLEPGVREFIASEESVRRILEAQDF